MNKKIIDVSYIILVLTISSILYLIYWKDSQIDSETVTSIRQRHAYQLSLSTLNELMLMSETGQRGFMLTDDAAYLAPYEQARKDIDSTLLELGNYDKTTEEEQKLKGLVTLVNEKLSELDKTVSLVDQDKDNVALKIIKTDRGRKLMDEIQANINTLKSLNNIEIETGRRKRTNEYASLTFVLICCVLLAVLLIFITHYLNSAKLKELDRREELHRHKLIKLEKVLNLFNSAEGIRHFISVGPLITKSVLEILMARYCCMIIKGRKFGLEENIYYASDTFGNPHFPDELKLHLAQKGIRKRTDPKHAVIDFEKVSDIVDDKKTLKDFISRYGDNIITIPLGMNGAITVIGSQGREDYQEDELYIFDILSNALTNLVENSLLNDSLNKEQQNKDNFIGQLGHEIRNPLAVISSTIDGIRFEIYTSYDEPIDIIERQCIQISKLVDDLLDITRISKGKFEVKLREGSLVLEVAKVVDDFKMLAANDSRPVSFQSTLSDEDDSKVLMDSTRIQQLLMNLLMNAYKFSDSDSAIDVKLEADSDDYIISVRDHGIGLTEDQVENMFAAFWQAEKSEKNGKKGLGLGLALVKEIAERHEGSVSAQSDGVDKGTTILVRVPKLKTITIEGAAPIKQQFDLLDSRKKVLVVDDEIDLCKNTVNILQKNGYNAVGAYNGKEAVKLLAAFSPDFLLTDISMPGEIDGYGVAKAARRFDNVRLMAMSGMTQEKDREKALSHGFQYFFAKPLKYNDLLNIIKVN